MKFYEVNIQSDDYVPKVKKIMSDLGINGGADIIFASDLFRYMNSPQAAIRNTRKLLANDGMLIVRDCDDSNKLAYPDKKGVLDGIVECSEKAHGMPNYYIGRELPLLIQNGGFDICDVRLDIQTTINQSFEAKEEFFMSTFESRKNIAKQMLENEGIKKDELLKLIEYVDKMEDMFYNKGFWYSESNLTFIAKKNR